MFRKSFNYFRENGWKKILFYKVSIINKKDLEETFKRHKLYAIIHFSGKKAVDESEEKPLF
jgi:UDP-glucose 4-epimerase